MTSSPRPDIFIIGPPRSGTTWLQRIIGLHPEVATPRETHFVHEFLSPFEAAWLRQSRAREQSLAEYMAAGVQSLDRMGGSFGGLPSLLSEDEFHELLRLMYGRLRERALGLKPGSTTFLEKTPSNSLHVDLIARLAPGCRFIHIVRDPFDAVGSLLEASKGWGKAWAPTDVGRAARTYRTHMEGALEAERFGSRYQLVRYEDILVDAANQVFNLLTNVGITTSLGQCKEMINQADRGRVPQESGPTPFVGINRAAVDGATLSAAARAVKATAVPEEQRQLSDYDRWCIDRETSHLMQRFGYSAQVRTPSSRPLYEARRFARRFRGGVQYEWRQLRTRLDRERS